MPAVRETPSESFSLTIDIVIARVATLLELFIDLFDVEVSHISEGVMGNDTALFSVGAIRVHLDNDLGHFSAIALDLGLNVGLIVDLLFAHLAANSVGLSDNRHDLLKFHIDLTQLL